MDYFTLKEVAKALASGLMEDLKAGRLKKIGGEEVELACDLALENLSSRERETLVYETCRAVVNLAL